MHIMTVSAFIAYLNDTFKAIWDSQQVALEGEVTSYRCSQGQWINFDLKDEGGLVSVFMPAAKLNVPVQDGMRVRLYGWPRVYPKYGKFSFSAERVELVGEGALQKALQMLRAKLEKEGLFDPTRKRTLTRFPRRIALVASRESAAYGDFVRILTERWGGLDIDLYHVMVQGDQAPPQIAAAIQTAQLQHAERPYDALVLTRGGGSLEELMAFNDERVVRALFSSRIPTLVAIGHERDLSLAEEVADVRGSTPTDCARRLVPDRGDVLYELATVQESISDSLESWIESAYARIERIMVRTDAWLQQCRFRFTHLDTSIQTGFARWLEKLRERLELLDRLVRCHQPEAVLKRGYAIVRNKLGNVQSSAGMLGAGEEVSIQLKDGKVNSVISSS
ncbi:exodeoxyribonuclease VII large subunit [Patescibacteria group bacterium]|nr:exodeoxyribonuclease VII large subunit [Patescibacteria group bacterium]